MATMIEISQAPWIEVRRIGFFKSPDYLKWWRKMRRRMRHEGKRVPKAEPNSFKVVPETRRSRLKRKRRSVRAFKKWEANRKTENKKAS